MRFAAFIAVAFLAVPVGAQEPKPVGPEPGVPAAEKIGDYEPAIVPVLKNKKAPYAGLLVPELRFTELVMAEIKLETTEQKLKAQTRFTESLEAMYRRKLEEAAQGPEWYEEPSFNRWLGFSIGIVVTGFVVWGSVEIVRVTNGN